VQEQGKPALSCRLVKSWRTEDGNQAHQVQVIATGEMLTIVEGGDLATPLATSRPRRRTVAMRIFRWGASRTAPVGVPVPPGETIVEVPSNRMTFPVAERYPQAERPPVAERLPMPARQPVEVAASGFDPKSSTAVPYAAPSNPVPATTAPPAPAPATTWPTAHASPAPSTPPASPYGPERRAISQPRVSTPVAVSPGDAHSSPYASSPAIQPVPAPESVEVRAETPAVVPGVKPAAVSEGPPVAVPVEYPADESSGPRLPILRRILGRGRTEPVQGVGKEYIVEVKPEESKKEYLVEVKPKAEVKPEESGKEYLVEVKEKPEGTPPAPVPPGGSSSPDWRKSWGKVESVPVEPVVPVEPTPVEKVTEAPGSDSGPVPVASQAAEQPEKEIAKGPEKKQGFFRRLLDGKKSDPRSAKKDKKAEGVKTYDTRTAKDASKPAEKKPEVAKAPTPGWRDRWEKILPGRKAAAKPPVDVSGLPRAKKDGSDPIEKPGAFARKGLVPTDKTPAGAKKDDPKAVQASLKTQTGTPSASPAAAGSAESGSTPPGSGSVVAAGSPQYVPVPIVTLPPMTRNGQPMLGSPPQAPQPNAGKYAPVNPLVTPPPGYANAFTRPGPQRPVPAETIPPEGTLNAFSGPVIEGQGTPPPAVPALAAHSPGFNSTPNGYPPPPHQTGRMPVLPHGMPQMPPQAVAWMPPQFVPANYYVSPAMANAQAMMAQAGHHQAQYQGQQTALLMKMLSDSDYPSQREWAAEQLAVHHAGSPLVPQALLAAASDDPAAMVRACCVLSLKKMGANSQAVASGLKQLQADKDPRVRDAVRETLTAFGIAPAPGDPDIRPVTAPSKDGK
jgi:hypothetical protein